VDFDGDGLKDIISGSWPGEVYLFKGKSDGTFDKGVELRYKDGRPINPGGGRLWQSGDLMLFAGKATTKETKDGTIIIYYGEEIKVPRSKRVGLTGKASTAFAVDWDGDGDLDLLLGNIDGNVYLARNVGSRGKPAYAREEPLYCGTAGAKRVAGEESAGRPADAALAERLAGAIASALGLGRAGGRAYTEARPQPGEITVPGDAAPIAADWDLDGDLDLIVGDSEGNVWLYRNIGKAGAEPKLALPIKLVDGSWLRVSSSRPGQPSSRAKPCVADWDGDGLPDLLVGDYCSLKREVKLTEEQKKAKEQYSATIQRYLEIDRKVRALGEGPEAEKQRRRLRKEMKKLAKQLMQLSKQLPREYESHGWVWFFKRKHVAKPTGPAGARPPKQTR